MISPGLFKNNNTHRYGIFITLISICNPFKNQ